MIANVVLGNNIDTEEWIKELKQQSADHIFVIDYEYWGEPYEVNGVIYLSSTDFKFYCYKYDSLIYHKSMYFYPGMFNLRKKEY